MVATMDVKSALYEGHYKSRMCFFEQDCPLRTDESFCNRDDPYHHVDNSILEDIGTGFSVPSGCTASCVSRCC